MEKYFKKSLKASNGITLIALVITIIVLLILAGISIQMLTGDNGILTRAGQAKERNDEAQIIEEARMDILAEITENKGKDITEKQLKDVLLKYFNSSEVNELDIQGNLAESTDKLTTIDGKYKIKVSDIYSGNIQPIEPGLYDQETGTLKMSWDDLVQNGLIAETNGVVSCGTNNERYNLEGKLVFPSNITKINYNAFTGYTKLREVILPNGLNEIKAQAFLACSGITGTLKIPNSVTEIDASAFSNCTGITKLELGDNITTIGGGAFSGCTSLRGDILISNSVENLGGQCFANCQLNTLTVDMTIIPTHNDSNNNCFAGLRCSNFIIGDNVEKISSGAIASCTGITGNLKIGNKVETIEAGAFAGCSNITGDIELPNSVKVIDVVAFQGLTGVDSITVNANVETVEPNSFTGVKLVYYDGELDTRYWGATEVR